MIKDLDGNKLTPKQKAQDLLMEAMTAAMYYLNEDPHMTAAEKRRVEDQMVKQKERVEKLFGFPPGAWRFQ